MTATVSIIRRDAAGSRSPQNDPVVRREIRRYRALRAVGLPQPHDSNLRLNHGCADGVCEKCYRTIWNRAGVEDFGDDDVLAALQAEAATIGAIAAKHGLSGFDRERLLIAAGRINAAYRHLR